MKKLLYLFIFYPLMLSAQTLEPEYKTAIGTILPQLPEKKYQSEKSRLTALPLKKNSCSFMPTSMHRIFLSGRIM